MWPFLFLYLDLWRIFWDWLKGRGWESLEQQAAVSWDCYTADSLHEGSENQHVAGDGDRDGHTDEASAHEGHADEVSDHEGHADEVSDHEGHADEVSDHEGHADEVSDHEDHADEVSDHEGHADEVSDHEDHADEASGEGKNSLWNWRKGHPCYILAKSLASLCPCPEAPWKAELHCDQLWCLTRELSEQRSIQAAAWLLLKAYSQMREQRDDFKRAFLRSQRELFSQRSPQGIERTGWPEQPPGKKIKANKHKQRFLGLNPSNKDAWKGFQKRAPKLTWGSGLLPKRLLTSTLIPKGRDVVPRSRSPWRRSCTGDVAGGKNVDLKSQQFSAQLKRKPWEARKKAAFKQGSLWKSSGVMSHGAVEAKPLWRPQKKAVIPVSSNTSLRKPQAA